MKIIFENLPEVVSQILTKVVGIERILLNQEQPETDQWFDIIGLCNYHPDKPARATVYTWVREQRIPYHKQGKKLAFLKSEIDSWIKQGRKMTTTEITQEASSYLRATRRSKNRGDLSNNKS